MDGRPHNPCAYLDAVTAALPSALVDPRELTTLRAALRLLPLSRGIIERELAAPDTSIDVSIPMAPGASWPGRPVDQDRWSVAETLHDRWSTYDHQLKDVVKQIGLELDLHTGDPTALNVFLNLSPAPARTPDLLIPDAVSALRAQRLDQLINLSSASPRIRNLGIMMARADLPTRCNLRIPDATALQTLIDEWIPQGLDPETARLTELISPTHRNLRLCITLDDHGLTPYADLECCTPSRDRGAFLDTIDRFQQHAICSAAEAAALRSSCDLHKVEDYVGPWETSITAAADVFEGYRPQLVTGLHHLKIGHDAAGRRRGKAYVWYGHRLLDPSGRWCRT